MASIDADVVADSGGASSSSGVAPGVGSLDGVASPAAAAGGRALLGERLSVEGARRILLEGVYATYEKRDKPGKSYERLRAECSLCKCRISRGWVKNPPASVVPEDVFPLAYVGCWLSRCKLDGSIGSHRGWQPSVTDVEEDARRCHWL